jgi:hypothetical protein
MTYEEMLRQLLGAARLGVDFGLERVTDVLADLGIRTGGWGASGTSGDQRQGLDGGDARRDAAARRAAHRALHLAPPGPFTERIRIDGREADRDALAARYARVVGVAPPG